MGLATAALAPALASCSRAEGGASLGELREQGFVRVGLANEIPFGFVDDAGDPAGQSPAVAKAVFEELGVPEIVATATSWDRRVPGLQNNQFDSLAAGAFITPERGEEVAFSEPTATAPEAFLVELGNPAGIQTFEDIAADPDLRLAVLNASVEQTYAEYFGVAEDQMELIPDQTTGFEHLEAGRVRSEEQTSELQS